VSQADELLSPAGAELLHRLQGQAITAERALSLAAELRKNYKPEIVAAALTQQVLRTSARQKFSQADDMLFTRPGLEQASSELTAAHSARRFQGRDLVADLCCGIGGNLIALATVARQVVGVDADFDTLRFAGYNAAVTAPTGNVALACADVRTLRLPRAVTAAFVDPARREAGRRLRAGDSEPPLDWCIALANTIRPVCIKAAPGLPHDLIPPGWELEFVATGRALKEALLWSPAFATSVRRATILPASVTLVPSPGDPIGVGEPGEYLLDPNPAVTRAGLVQELGRDLGARQLDEHTAFLSLDSCVSTPFARTLRVLESMPWHERQAARRLRELGVGAADIRRRGVAGDVEQIRRSLGLRGDRQATIVLTRRAGKPWGLICEPVADQAADPDPEAPR
jgi:SAM-dependent methyltransferase